MSGFKIGGSKTGRMISLGLKYNDTKVVKALGRLPNIVRNAVLEALHEMAERTKEEIIKIITTGSRTGKVYSRNGRMHVASAAGEPPANDTGELVSSVYGEVDSDSLTMEAGADAAHAKWLEFGNERIEPRPFLRVVRQMLSGYYIQVIKEKVSMALRRVGGSA